MPLYEYECSKHSGKPVRFEQHRPMSESSLPSPCPLCGEDSQRIISLTHWYMGWKFLKDKSEKSPAAPTDAGYHPEWDQAYAP